MDQRLTDFVDAYSRSGDLEQAFSHAFPERAPGMTRPERIIEARRLRDLEDAQEYLAFLTQEGRSRGAVPLAEHLFDLDVLKVEAEDLIGKMMARGGSSDAAAASMFRHKLRAEIARGQASGHYANRTEIGIAGANGGKITVDWSGGN